MTATNLLLALALTIVNPFIGSGGHGHVFVGADIPHGEIHAGPMNTTLGWDWCSGYHDSDSSLAGYAQTRMSGTGVADYGDIVILPQIVRDTAFVDSIVRESMDARPGYFSLLQGGSRIRTEITSTARCALYRIRFPKAGEGSYLKVDLKRGAKSLLFRKEFVGGEIRQIDSRTIVGKRVSNEWTFSQPIWFVARFSRPIKSIDTDGSSYALLDFGKARKLGVRVAVSQIGPDGLMDNLKESRAGFAICSRRAQNAWRQELSAISFEGLTAQQDTIFYTSLYHTAMAPQLISDAGQKEAYTIFSLWDTYRAVHPLFNLIDSRAGDYCNSLLDIYDRTGKLPVWILGDQETGCMVGVHSIAVLCEAALKGVPGVDPSRVLEACSHMIEQPTYGMNLWDEYGYLPAEKVNWSVSVELEYCIDAKAIALLAHKLGEEKIEREYEERAARYRRHFDTQSGYMRAVMTDGSFHEPFNPSFSLHEEADYVEGNAWQYTFLVPQDIEGLAELFGGNEGLERKLDELFTADSSLNEGASADITGMIGQYAHGNEPSHHIAYIYTLLGRPDKAAAILRQVCEEFYTTAPDGLIGNEDCGQMSAWYVFTALGFYPLDPCSGRYVFGSPLCKSASIRLSNGKTLRIKTEGNSETNCVIESVAFNGAILNRPYITHDELMSGGEIVFKMTRQ